MPGGHDDYVYQLLWPGPLLDHLTRFDKQRADYACCCSSLPNDTITQVNRRSYTRPARHWPGLQTFVTDPLAPGNSGEILHRRTHEPHTSGRAASPTLTAKGLPCCASCSILLTKCTTSPMLNCQVYPSFEPVVVSTWNMSHSPHPTGNFFALVFGTGLLCLSQVSTQLYQLARLVEAVLPGSTENSRQTYSGAALSDGLKPCPSRRLQ